jgi:hypothetical protein
MSEKINAVLKIDANWRIGLTGIDFENQTIDNLVIYREDGKFFTIRLTRILGYIFPMIFETLNKAGIAGTICLLVRQDQQGNQFVVVEKKNCVNSNGEKVICVRACRSSISSPEGSPIPPGSRKENVFHGHDIELNNMRIAGQVATYVVSQAYDLPLEAGQELMSFADFAATDDGPGQAVLAQYLLAK